ncbi:MAG: ATP-binding protein [Treponema bryantii]|nr:ATP-binding protein [Treponema bryantii]
MQILTFSPFGYEGSLVTVETELRRGIPAVDIVGLADGSVKESRERIRAAIANSGLEFPPERVLISLSPADLKKEGSGFNLPVALSVLAETNKESYPSEKVFVMGELLLAGNIENVRGIEAGIETAINEGVNYFIVPKDVDYDFPENCKVLKVSNLSEAVEKSKSIENFISIKQKEKHDDLNIVFPEVDEDNQIDQEFLDKHSEIVKAIEIAVAGKHNLLLTGAPGCGKTMITLKLIPALTPYLTEKEAKIVNRIESLAGLPINNELKAPFRMPHQTASLEGMCGGGVNCRPGEISLATNGTLFLDETAEFRTSVLQILRVPLESKYITLSRAGRSTVYPAKFQLVMATNPSADGNFLVEDRICLSSAKSIEQYWKKFSAPLLDRVEIKKFMDNKQEENGVADSIEEIKNKIATAYKIQRKRGVYNAHLTPSDIENYCKLKDEASKAFFQNIEKTNLSPRGLNNILKVSLTIANMDGREQILKKDLKQAFEISSDEKMRTILNLNGFGLEELPKEERNYAWYTYKGEEVVIVGQHVDNSFETEKFNGIKPLYRSDVSAILRISDIENAGIEITPDDVQGTLDHAYSEWVEPVEIVCDQVVNPENNQRLSPYTFVTEAYFNEDLIERQLLTDTTKYHDWTSERTSFVHKTRDEVTLKEETLAEWKKVCSEITNDFSENGSNFNFDELWENITDYRNNQGIDCSEYILDKFLDKVKEKEALKGFSEDEEKVIINFLSSKGITGVRKLSEFKDPSKKAHSEKQEKKKNKDISGREM